MHVVCIFMHKQLSSCVCSVCKCSGVCVCAVSYVDAVKSCVHGATIRAAKVTVIYVEFTGLGTSVKGYRSMVK